MSKQEWLLSQRAYQSPQLFVARLRGGLFFVRGRCCFDFDFPNFEFVGRLFRRCVGIGSSAAFLFGLCVACPYRQIPACVLQKERVPRKTAIAV